MAASVALYATPSVPLGRLVVVMETGAVIDTLKACAARWPAESVTWTVKLNEPEAVGVPEMAPEELSARPAGGDPAVTLQL